MLSASPIPTHQNCCTNELLPLSPAQLYTQLPLATSSATLCAKFITLTHLLTAGARIVRL